MEDQLFGRPLSAVPEAFMAHLQAEVDAVADPATRRQLTAHLRGIRGVLGELQTYMDEQGYAFADGLTADVRSLP